MASDDSVIKTSQYQVEVSPNSHLAFSKLRQYGEVVFWERPEIPEIPTRDMDTVFSLKSSNRIDNLANSAFGDSNLSWLLAQANDVRLPPLGMNPGYSFRIPMIQTVIKVLRNSR